MPLPIYTLYYKPRYNSDEEITNLSEITDGDGKYFDRALTGAAVSYDNGSLRVGANNFIVNNSSKIYLVARKGNAFMADSTKNHEIDRVSGTELESTLRGYAINNGSVSGAFVSDSSNVVDTMYITVKDSVGYDFDDVTVSPTALNVAHDGTGTFNVVLPAGKTATIASADITIATVSVSSAAASATTPVVVSPVAKNGATTINVVVTDSNGISMTYQVRVTVTGFAAPTEIVGDLAGDLGDSFKDPRITDAQGNPKSTANVGETVQVVIEQKPAPVTRAVDAPATAFEKDQYYKVTLGADNTVKTVQCKVPGKLTVEYQVVAGDLNETTKKITINVSAIVSAAPPVDPPAKYTVTGITDATEVTGGDSMTFTVASDKASAAKDEEVTLTATLNKVVPDGKKVTVTFTAPTGKTIEIAAGNKTGTATFTMGAAAVTVAATAAEADATNVPSEGTKSVYTSTAFTTASQIETEATTFDVTIGEKTYPVAKEKTSVEDQAAAWVAAYNADTATNGGNWTASNAAGVVTITYKDSTELQGADDDAKNTSGVKGDFTNGDGSSNAAKVEATLASASTTETTATTFDVTIDGKTYAVAKEKTSAADQLAAWVAAFNADDGVKATWGAEVKDNTVVITAKAVGATANNLGMTGGTFEIGTAAGTP